MKTIEEPARRVPLYGEYEVAVLGGGPAGIAAAVAAARAGRTAGCGRPAITKTSTPTGCM